MTAEHIAGIYDDVLEPNYSRTTTGYEHWMDDMQTHNGCQLAIGHTTGGDADPTYHAAVVDCVDHECVVAVISEWSDDGTTT